MADNETQDIKAESNGPLVNGIAIGFVVASAAVLSLRLYTRLVLLKTAGKNDWTMLIAMYLLIVILHYNTGMNVVKVSFLLQYRRVFVSKVVQRVCFWAMVYVVVWACFQATLLGLSCLPMAIIVPSTAGFCLDTLPIWYFSSAMSLATNFMIFCIPLPSVLRLQLPRKQKAMLFGIFCLGFFVCIISVYRMFTLRTAVSSNKPPWENIGAAIWSAIELNTSIICWLPGAGLSSAHTKTSAYHRYGPSSGMGRGTFKELKSGQREVSTEEPVLEDMNASQSGSMPSVYAHITADPELGHRDRRIKGSHQNQIMVTTETMIKEGRQMGISRNG
ncbi:hypothetical protein BDP81DRAFT_511068 [Colletotrichum phormii]|uniref:Rhodopsin domain-containing protein n=1 Tax=Colletotrichum phormii TaxID=359342 RepID=A0AAI9ZC57_9PEZI|nr:uncharacterized protein BDP81DRAFT_511068 [Colletotrichum phormii]KAK1621803.1 hypothetical protein BDP81DRAFT_511068 [Colletotrichum phormii]